MSFRKIWILVLYVLGAFFVCQKIWLFVFTSKKTLNYQTNQFAANYVYPISKLPSEDYQQLIDLKNFSFIIFNQPCNGSAFLLLVLVHSRFDNFAKRMIIRETWGRSGKDLKVLFVIAFNDNEDVKETLQEENMVYGDIIEGSFNDNYKNMTYKHVMVFKYVIYHCSQAKYILKTDDDVFVNMPLMMHFLKMDLSPFGCSKLLFCSLRTNSKVFRSWRSKWRVSFEEYPDKFYPPYCPGWAILYSPDVLFDLYKEAQKSNYFWIDDVLITGVLAQKLNLSHTDADSLVLSKFQTYFPSTISKLFLYGYPGTTISQIRALWRYASKQNLDVSLLNKIE